ncbi:MAG: hypothetical protein AAFU64_05630, partial [Bacteroidota bacterium]
TLTIFSDNQRNLFSASLLFLIVILLNACNCQSTTSYKTLLPVYADLDELRQSVKSSLSRPLKNPGKIYYKDGFVFINEIKEGIHIVDNRDPRNPRKVSFVEIPGNFDLAIKGNVLYADSYIDLLALDIANPEEIEILTRLEGVFENQYYQEGDALVTEWKEEWVTETTSYNCNNGLDEAQAEVVPFVDARGEALLSGGSTSSGIGGSLARFTISGDFLYTVDETQLRLFDIAQPQNPMETLDLPLGWGIETIFPYRDKLFIGSRIGMHIYDNSNPAQPTYVSTYEHVESCDPVVVQDDYAYVTLRSGNFCNNDINQLDVIDISDIESPNLVKSYPMDNPHGLGIQDSLLFICEGDFGLKLFDANDPMTIDQHLLLTFPDLHSYDVIPLGRVLLMIGEDGLYQFDYSRALELELLSVIPIER